MPAGGQHSCNSNRLANGSALSCGCMSWQLRAGSHASSICQGRHLGVAGSLSIGRLPKLGMGGVQGCRTALLDSLLVCTQAILDVGTEIAAHSAAIDAAQQPEQSMSYPAPTPKGGTTEPGSHPSASHASASPAGALPLKRSLAPELDAELSPSQHSASPGALEELSPQSLDSRDTASPAASISAHAKMLRERRDSHKKASTQVHTCFCLSLLQS